MFYRCNSLSNINPLKNWNVSNGNKFLKMFAECGLSNINAIKNWKISKNHFIDILKD